MPRIGGAKCGGKLGCATCCGGGEVDGSWCGYPLCWGGCWLGRLGAYAGGNWETCSTVGGGTGDIATRVVTGGCMLAGRCAAGRTEGFACGGGMCAGPGGGGGCWGDCAICWACGWIVLPRCRTCGCIVLGRCWPCSCPGGRCGGCADIRSWGWAGRCPDGCRWGPDCGTGWRCGECSVVIGRCGCCADCDGLCATGAGPGCAIRWMDGRGAGASTGGMGAYWTGRPAPGDGQRSEGKGIPGWGPRRGASGMILVCSHPASGGGGSGARPAAGFGSGARTA
jgi:hypothetical protein